MPVDLSSLVMNIGRRSSKDGGSDVVDIITFVESSWGLGMKLYPVQRVILKAHYGLELDDNPEGFDLEKPIPLDHPNYDEVIDYAPHPSTNKVEVVDLDRIGDHEAIGLRTPEGKDYVLQRGDHWDVTGTPVDTLESIADAINLHAGKDFKAEVHYGTNELELSSKAFSSAGNEARLELSSAKGLRIAYPPTQEAQVGYAPDAHNFYGGGGGFYRYRIVVTDFRRENARVMTEAGYLKYLNDEGRCNISEVIPGKQRREMVLSVGRRSGKTLITSCIVAYETYKLLVKGNPQKYYGASQSGVVQLISVATDKDQAGLLYREASGHFSKCFASETEILTDEGVKRIGDLVGSEVTLLTRNGSWVKAPIRSFGVQPLYKIALRRQGVVKEVYATAEHRWFAQDYRSVHRGKGYREFTTTELRPGKHKLQATFGRSYKNRIHASPFGVAHGFTFGDGSDSQGERNSARAYLFGEKDKALLPFFLGCPTSEIPPDSGEIPDTYCTGHKRLRRKEAGVRVGALPNFFKAFPSIRENKAYLLGWAMGYFAADGCVSKGQVSISSAERENLEFFRDVCVLLGIGTYSIRSEERVSNITGREHTLYRLTLMRHTLDESFFVLDSHRESFAEAGGSNIKRKDYHWTVVSVEPTNRVEEVFCATVEDHRDFVLEGNIATGNCDYFKPYAANATQSFATFQTPYDIENYGSYSENPKARYSINVTFRSCVAKGLRGGANILVALDEVAHFGDKGQASADEVYQAVEPSTRTFSRKDPETGRPLGENEGRIIMISSPLGKQGLFYKQFMLGFGNNKAADNLLCIQAPTWEVNPTVPAETFVGSYLKDPRVFETEFGAIFTDRTRGWIEDHKDLFACIDPKLRPRKKAPPRVPHFMGLDYALVGDYCAAVIGHAEPNGQIVVDLVERIRAGEGDYAHLDRLSVDDIADWIEDLCNRFYIVKGLSDQAFGIVVQQELQKRGLSQIEYIKHPKTLTSQMFANFKDLMYDEKVTLYDWPRPKDDPEAHSPFIQELLELQATMHSKHVITVEAPQVEGKHDDMADALVRMTWLALNHKSKYVGFATGNRAIGHMAGGQGIARARMKARQGGTHPSRQVPRSGRGGTGRW